MRIEDIAAAVQRVKAVLDRRPSAAIHDDAPAAARWQAGLHMVARHAEGAQVSTDLPVELGGDGAGVTPGWLLRAALASCLATRVAMEAAAAGIELSTLEVLATSRSDLRGLLGMVDATGEGVNPGPIDVQLHVRISAAGIPAARLRRLVEESHRSSPVAAALQDSLPVALSVEADGG